MNNLFFGLITLAVLVLAGFIVYFILELKKTIVSLRFTLEALEKTVVPAIEELQITIKSVRKITDDVGAVSEEVKGLSGTIHEVSQNVKYVSEAVSKITTNSATQISGVRAGIKAGFGYFISNLLAKGKQE